MSIERTESQRNNTISLANEFIFHSFMMDRETIKRLFSRMSVNEYVIMWMLFSQIEDKEGEQKLYLREIVEKSKIPMGRVSQIVRELQDKGFVQWKHDGRGEDGTYILLTDTGVKTAMEQQEILGKFYGSVIEQFGKDRFRQLMSMLNEFEGIMNRKIEQEGEN